MNWQEEFDDGDSDVQEIETFLQFTPLEKREYEEDLDEIRISIQSSIRKYNSNFPLKFLPESEQIVLSIRNLISNMISCGEHKTKIKNNSTVQSSNPHPTNILFNLICSNKIEISDVCKEIIKSVINDAQVFWVENNFGGVEKRYEQLMKLIEFVGNLNRIIDQLKTIDFEEKNLENDEEPRRKMRKMAENEDEKKMNELRRNVLTNLNCDNLAKLHLMSHIEELAKHSEKAKKWIEEGGGIQKIKDSLIHTEHSEHHQKIQRVFEEKCGDLKAAKMNCAKILKKLVDFYEFYQNKRAIEMRLRKNLREYSSIFEDLSFWPIFEEPRKHFEDNYHHIDDKKLKPKNEMRIWRHPHHYLKTCMGTCDFKYSYLYPTYKIASDYGIYRNIFDHFELIERLTAELIDNFQVLLQNSQLFDHPICHHSTIKIRFDENRRIDDRNRLNCDVCRVSHSLAHFQFAIGNSSLHGCQKAEGHFGMIRIIDLILKDEGKIQKEDLGFFEKFVLALNEFAGFIQNYREEFLQDEKEKILAKTRKTVEDFRNEAMIRRQQEMRWKIWYAAMRKTSHAKNAEIFETRMPEFVEKFKELVYILNVVHQQNAEETKNDESVNSCPICCQYFHRIAIFPCIHQICENCLQRMIQHRSNPVSIFCPKCRRSCKQHEILIGEKPKRDVGGSSKLKKIIELIRQFLNEDQKNRIVIFTNFTADDSIWKCIVEYLKKSKLDFFEENQKSLENGRIVLSSTTSDFPIIANYAIFVDQMKSEIQKSINRISPKKRLTIYHLFMEDSIEEKLWKISKSDVNFTACVIILAAWFPRGTDAFFCVDSAKGWCETNDMWGYCMLNKTVGSWQCDSGETCGKKDAIKNRKVNGCTKDLCCCNTGDGCSLAFIKLAEEHGQKCLNQNEAPNSDPEHFRDCDDPYCYSFLVSEEEGGQTTASRGCYHRSLLKHQMFLKEDKNYQNNTKWKETERLFSIPTCQEILSQTEKSAGNSNSSSVSQCVDFSWEQLEDPEDPTSDQIPMKGRLCCCEGGALCNSNHGWADNGVSLPELQQMIQDSKSNSSAFFATSSTTVLFVFFLACTFKFF